MQPNLSQTVNNFGDYFVKINLVLTRVIQCGLKRFITSEEDIADEPLLILMISGNPGEIGYYCDFLLELNKQTNLPVIGLSHAGHNNVICKCGQSLPSISENGYLYSLEGQIYHKIAFIIQFISANTKIILMGHSIGCYMALEILHRKPDIASRVIKSILIFPTIESIGETSEGRKYKFLFKYMKYPLLGLSYILQYLTEEWKEKLIEWAITTKTSSETPPKCAIRAATNLFNPTCLMALIYMSLQEFEKVKMLNSEAIEQHKNTLTLLYGNADQWCPLKYYHRIVNIYPDVDARLCLNDMGHAFVLNSSETKQISLLVSQIINSITL